MMWHVGHIPIWFLSVGPFDQSFLLVDLHISYYPIEDRKLEYMWVISVFERHMVAYSYCMFKMPLVAYTCDLSFSSRRV